VLEERYASLQLTLIVPANRQHYERQKTVPRVAQAVPGACALLQERKPTVEVQFADRQEAESEERACAHAGGDGVWRRGRRGKRAVEATARLGDQSHPETVVPEGTGKLNERRPVSSPLEPFECDPEIVALAMESGRPGPLGFAAEESERGRFGKGEEIGGMAAADLCFFPACRQLFRSELAHRLQHPK